MNAYTYFKATDYFYNKTTSLIMPPAPSNFTGQEIANYNLASILCKIPKRQLISDADYLSKEINIAALSNYVSSFPSFRPRLLKYFFTNSGYTSRYRFGYTPKAQNLKFWVGFRVKKLNRDFFRV